MSDNWEEKATEFVANHPSFVAFVGTCLYVALGLGVMLGENKLLAKSIAKELKKL